MVRFDREVPSAERSGVWYEDLTHSPALFAGVDQKVRLAIGDGNGWSAKSRLCSRTYATSMRALVETGAWRDEGELMESYDKSMSYCYFHGKVEESRSLFTRIVSTIDLVSQERDKTEYEFVDLDHYYEFFGGLARSVREKKGAVPEQWVVDATEEVAEAVGVGISIDRAVRTRLFNSRWVEAMLDHRYHGAQKIADRIEYLIGLRATTGCVNELVFREAMPRFLLDSDMRLRLFEKKPVCCFGCG